MRPSILLLVLLMSPPVSAHEPKNPPKQPVPCSAAEHRQFDFWLGEVDDGKTGRLLGVRPKRP